MEPYAVRFLRKHLRRIFVLSLVAASFALLLFQLDLMTHQRREGLDFEAFYAAGSIARLGQWSRLYDFGLQRRIEDAAFPGGPFMAYFHPPFEALLFAPLASLSFAHAFLVWGVANLAAITLVLLLLRATGYKLAGWPYATWLIICLFFALSDLALGQDALWLAVVFLLAFLALKRRRDLTAGAVLGLGLFRFEVLLPFVFIFLLRKRWRLAVGFCATGAAALLTSAALVGWAGLGSYLRMLGHLGLSSRSVHVDSYSRSVMPSLYGASQAVFHSLIPKGPLFAAVSVTTLLLLGWSARHLQHLERTDDPAFALEFSLAVIAALLAGYYVFISELAPLIVAGFLILSYESARRREAILGNRRGTALLLLFLGAIVAEASIHVRYFSVEVIVLLGLMVCLSQEISFLGASSAPR